MGDDDLLAEPVVAVGVAALALTAPHADERQQGQQRGVQVRARAQIRGVRGNRQIVEGGDVAGRGDLGPFQRRGHRPVAGAGSRCVAVGAHPSSVTSRWTAYSANQVMTTTATTSRNSKNRTDVDDPNRQRAPRSSRGPSAAASGMT